jgi:NADH-quinone oxidoreductase subunit N
VTGAVLSGAAGLRLFAPEIVLAMGALLVLTVGLVRRETPRSLALGLAIAALAASALAAVLTAPAPAAEGSDGGRALFGGLLARDGFGDFFTLLFAAGGIVVALASTASDEGRSDEGSSQVVGHPPGPSSSTASSMAAGSARWRADRDATEYAALLVSVVLGAVVMAKATDLLTAYLALEFVSLLSYVLAAFSRRSRRSAEAGLKYAIYGGVATGAMLYGFSWLYGLAGSTDLGAVRLALAAAPPLVSGMVLALVLAGLGFKMALVPFHSWCPDVYEGAPTPIAAFFSVVPKAAGFALAFRFLVGAGIDPIDPTLAPGSLAAGARLVSDSGPATVLASALAVVAIASMTLGNLAAIAQSKLKRLLAYSSIAQAGTLAMALSVGTPAAERALLLYLGVYVFMNLAAFLAVTALVRAGQGDTLADVAGLGARAPVLAFGLTVALLSLAGLPPLGGFVAKFAMFSATIERGTAGGALIFYVLAAAAVVNTVVSVYYYARVAKVMYFDPAPRGARDPLEIPRMHTVLVSISAGFVVALGIYVSPLASLVSRSAALWSGR